MKKIVNFVVFGFLMLAVTVGLVMSPVPFDSQALAAQLDAKTQETPAKTTNEKEVTVTVGDDHANANGAAVGSPGVLSGNLSQIPVHVPVNVCGNTVDVIGLLNPAFGNTCVNP